MAVEQGNKISLFIDIDEDAATADVISQADLATNYAAIEGITSASISVSNATYETNFKDVTPAGAGTAPVLAPTRQYSVGTTTASLSVEGVFDPSMTIGAKEIFDEAKGKTSMGVFFSSGATGFKAVGGIGFCTSFEMSAGMDDFVTFSASFELDGNPHLITES
jgi:hypothetical protein